MHSKLSSISNATDRLTAPRNNDVILWQSALLRGHESHQHPAVRVLMLDFSTRAVATRVILVRSSTSAESRHLVRGGAQAKTIGSSDRTNRLCQAIISYPHNSPASVAGSFVARSFPSRKSNGGSSDACI